MMRNPLLAWASNPEVLERPVRIPSGLRGYSVDFGERFDHYMNTAVAVGDCPTGRLAYLEAKGVLSRDVRFQRAAEEGRLFHKAVEVAFRHSVAGRMDVNDFFAEIADFRVGQSTRGVAYKVYVTFFRIFSAIQTRSLAVAFVEKELSGHFMGLSHVRFDILVGNPPIVVDIKTGRIRKEHMLQVCAYALVYEHHTHTNVDFGGIWKVDTSSGVANLLLFPLDVRLRRTLLDRVGQKLRVLRNPEIDPGMDGDACGRCFWRELCQNYKHAPSQTES